MPQSEQQLEEKLLSNLVSLGYERVTIPDESVLLQNLKGQLEKHNGKTFSETEFQRVLNHLNKGNVFQRAHTLRDKYKLDKDDGTTEYIEFINQEYWCKNQYQVTNQITINGKRKNRYDVTILINGLPLCQIELKRRGLAMSKAFDQINRYHRDSFSACYGLFQYVQIFVISNGANSVYYPNNRLQHFNQVSYWTDKDNNKINQLADFARFFLEPCHLSKMITKYIVLHQTNKILMSLRPYQYYAAEAIQKLVQESTKNGYIWHTTGSGKTLTSFKASQLIAENKAVHKVLFVVDRNDLDYQTTKEFNEFADGSVDGTNNTRALIAQLLDRYKDPGTGEPKTSRLIVTTIQKLNNAITKAKYTKQLEALKDKKFVFIFDECHRSQFGDAHNNIIRFFPNRQMIGFTGTPIFKENAVNGKTGKWTTDSKFDQCLHRYLITNAIRDKKVLRFSVDYVGKWKKRDGTDMNLDVPGIDKKELFESDKRVSDVTNYIIDKHHQKTKQREFTAMFCTASVDMAIKYYEELKRRKDAGEHDFTIATIFTYAANEPSEQADGGLPDESLPEDGSIVNESKRDKLEQFVKDYNEQFGTNKSVKDGKAFEDYKKDISKRVKERERVDAKDSDRLDILIVAYMFLTGFDAKKLNTLYVDKNLKMHGLVQAFSRTNRILNKRKSHGDIVCFRPLKEKVDEAIALFSNKDAEGGILMEPYNFYLEKVQKAVASLLKIAPTPDSVHDIISDEKLVEFVQTFRELLRNKNIMSGFAEFNPSDIGIEEDDLLDYQSQYYDLQDKRDTGGEKVSVLEDIDFEVELLHRDLITVDYILALLATLNESKGEEREKQRKEIKRILDSEIKLRSKKELIEKFIEENLPKIENSEDIPESFSAYWLEQKRIAIESLAKSESLVIEGLENAINTYIYTGRQPMRADIMDLFLEELTYLKRRKKADIVLKAIIEIVERFED